MAMWLPLGAAWPFLFLSSEDMTETRAKPTRVTIRLTPEEYAQLARRARGGSLAGYMRRVLFGGFCGGTGREKQQNVPGAGACLVGPGGIVARAA